ncbi:MULTISPECIES: thermosome subunit beta [Methanosarcina]|uniref:Thermosome subunit n=6 Tax=Methanosarcina mazei TaxID=2209 RepID=A0A0F8KNY9_METMZ|nr:MULTISPECIES: thermosome subunit beta [Methanosarcina]AAM30792.1 Thermosome, alpha subunit [Methanosarcina mazei Go1]AKB39204.1 Heat shock protein 60 family chaperone GroEL [Methanosarcina mazei WWM610]AKB60197.1 Heat shock protein 60 family chaperone GroEL [Methanosarcina mazei SarPi]AKB63401.1 Heat shock protein 60 family chaperone GroEL [Methanosarcina mazei S-6]AKB66749.1 Heat shock protein 60 family chaperone GroEL [Methanosarcina mazei LYC]
MAAQPIFILREGSKRTHGSDAQHNNIMAAKAVAEAVRTTLGPKGMDKMLVDAMGDVVITNDGATILKEMDIEHPGAKMIVEVAKTQDAEVGDGTTTAAVLAGELLTKAEDLLESGVHPTVIASGYRLAAIQAVKILDTITISASPEDTETLEKIAGTAITGKGAESHKAHLSNLAVRAIKSIVEKDENGKITVDIEDVKTEKRPGGSIKDSEIVEGVIVDKERVHTGMPEVVKDAKVLLLSVPIELKKTETKAEIKITTPDQMQLFLDQEEAMLREIVDKVIDTGANVVFCQKGIDDLAQYYLTKAGIFAMRRVKKSDMDKLSRATGGRIITNLDEIDESDLGYAGMVEEKDVTGSRMTFVTGCKDSKTTSILLRGGTEHVVDGLERALEDALRVVGVALEDQKIVVGGGSPEIELSLRLKEYAATLKGREQLAVTKFAESLEVIPQTLAENAGLDPIDMLVEMRSQHEKGNKRAGLNVYKGKIEDMFENNVVEPLRIKTQAINAATEAAIMVLRIDDVIASTGGGRAAPGGMPGGDMEDMM